MDLEEIGINMRNWVDSTQDRDYWEVSGVFNIKLFKISPESNVFDFASHMQNHKI